MKFLVLKELFLCGLFLCPILSASIRDDAHLKYKTDFKDKPEGVYETENFIFSICEVPLAGLGNHTRDKVALNKAVLFRQRSLISNFIILNSNVKRQKLSSNSLLTTFPSLKIYIEKTNPAFFAELFDLEFSCFVLEDHRYTKKDVLRHAIAYKTQDIRGFTPKVIPWPTNSQIINELKSLFSEYKILHKKDDLHELLAVTRNLFDILSDKRRDLFEQYELRRNANRNEIEDVAYYNLVIDRAKSLELDSTVENARSSLEELPLFPPALEILQKHYRIKDPAKSLVLSLIGLPLDQIDEQHLDLKIFDNLDFNKSKLQYLDMCLQEFFQLFDSIQNYQLSKNYSEISFFRSNFYKLGFDFEKTLQNENPKYFEKASQLFKSGKNLNEVQTLCLSAIYHDPGHSAAWNLLGRTLSLLNNDLLAIPCFFKSLFLENSSLAKTNLAISLYKQGFIEFSKSVALSALLLEEIDDWQKEEVFKILDIDST